MTSEELIVQATDVPTGDSRDEQTARPPAPGAERGDSSESRPCSVWAMGLPADAVGPLEWWPPKRLKPYAPRHVTVPPFRGTPSWTILQHLVKESGVREPLLVLPDGQVVDGAHRLELAKALGLPEVPVRVLTVPERLREEDRIQVETMLAVLAAGRRHIAPSRVQGLLLGLTEAELAAGVCNQGVQNLRRGQAPAPGPQGPTQHALAASTGVSDRTVRRLVRVGRDGSENLKRAVASGAISLKEADRRLAATKTDEPPAGPLILRALPKAAIAWGDPKRPESGNECSSDTVTDEPRAEVASAPRAVPAADPHAAGPPVLPGPAPLPPAVQAFLALCQDMEAATERFRRETARWTGERRARRRLTIWQTIQHLNEQLEWMEATEGSRHGPTPS